MSNVIAIAMCNFSLASWMRRWFYLKSSADESLARVSTCLTGRLSSADERFEVIKFLTLIIAYTTLDLITISFSVASAAYTATVGALKGR